MSEAGIGRAWICRRHKISGGCLDGLEYSPGTLRWTGQPLGMTREEQLGEKIGMTTRCEVRDEARDHFADVLDHEMSVWGLHMTPLACVVTFVRHEIDNIRRQLEEIGWTVREHTTTPSVLTAFVRWRDPQHQKRGNEHLPGKWRHVDVEDLLTNQVDEPAMDMTGEVKRYVGRRDEQVPAISRQEPGVDPAIVDRCEAVREPSLTDRSCLVVVCSP